MTSVSSLLDVLAVKSFSGVTWITDFVELVWFQAANDDVDFVELEELSVSLSLLVEVVE